MRKVSIGVHHSSHLNYRPDIDGLRAVAVLAVIFFHAFPEVIRGGFVGVDIFFVISGYLITRILLNNLLDGTLNLRDFYIRRVFRIFPALILVLASTVIFGSIALYPNEFKELGKHIAAGAAFLSNFFFWHESGYFDKAGETKPLLHLWSLGIEEQYYILWPLLLYLAWSNRLKFWIAISAIGLVSFCISVYLVSTDSTQAFYAPWSRFWELLIGSSLAYFHYRNTDIQNKTTKGHLIIASDHPLVSKFVYLTSDNYRSLFGGALIIVAVIMISKGTRFPGSWALLPTIGACLVISAGPRAWLNRALLANPVMVSIGLISYPLYLWHWPLLSFAQIMASSLPPVSIRLIAIGIAFLLAISTYYFIERPIRRGASRFIKVTLLVLGMATMGFVGVGIYLNNDSRPAAVATAKHGIDAMLYSSCPFEGDAKSYCLTLNPAEPVDTVLIGDSHAGHLRAGLLELYNSASRNIAIQWGGDCLPFFLDLTQKQFSSVCDQRLINNALLSAVESPSITTVILSSYAIAKIQQRAESINRTHGYVNNPSSAEVERNARLFQDAMFRTIEQLQTAGKHVVYIVDIPELYFDPLECFARPLELPGHEVQSPCAVSRAEFESRNAEYHKIINEAKTGFPKATFIDAYKHLCDEKYCHAIIDNELLYKDRDHLNNAGSRYLARKISMQILHRHQ